MLAFAKSTRGVLCAVASAVLIAAVAPAAFAEQPDKWVRYVESTGSQWVDTGVIGRPNTKIEAKVEWVSLADSAFVASGYYQDNTRFYLCYCNASPYTMLLSQGTNVVVKLASEYWESRWEANRVYNYAAAFSATNGAGKCTGTVTVDGIGGGWSHEYTGFNSGRSLYVFANNSTDVYVGGKSKSRCYGLKIWQGPEDGGDMVLVRDFQPCMKGRRAGLYDAVSKTIFYSISGTDLVCDENSEVPDEFIEYVESQGVTAEKNGQKPAYIDTGVIGRAGTTAEFKETCLKTVANEFCLLGAKNSDANSRFFMWYHANGNTLGLGYANTYWRPSVNDPDATSSLGADDVYTLSYGDTTHALVSFAAGLQSFSAIDDGNCTTNLVSRQKISGSVNTGTNLYLFARNNNGTPDSFCASRLYGLKIWQDGALVRDFRPCLKNGVAGLYDDVSKKIFYSLGTPLVFDNKKSVDEDDVDLMFVDYIESDGNNTLDTGVPARSGIRARGEMAWVQAGDIPNASPGTSENMRTLDQERYRYLENTYQPNVFDRQWRAYLAAESLRTADRFFMVHEVGGALNFAYGSSGNNYIKPDGANILPTVRTKYSFDVSFADGAQTVAWNGTEVLSTNITGTVNTSNTLHLFSSSYWRNRSAARCYGLEIWQDGELVRDFRPCVYKNRGMLYDNVTKTLYRPSPDIPVSRTDCGVSEVYSSFDVDARANVYPITNAEGFAEMPPITFGTNDAGTVTVVDPNTGASSTYTKSSWEASLGGSPWAPGDGGSWRFKLDGVPAGGAVFKVGYRQYRELDPSKPTHAGTMLDPEVLYHGGELAEYGDRDGFVFRLAEGVDAGTLVTPSDDWGYLYIGKYLGNDLYSLVEGAEHTGRGYGKSGFAIDTRQDGKLRIALSPAEIPPIAYTADGWAYESSEPVTLTLRAPGGATTVYDSTGTGSYNMPLSDLTTEYKGRWRVTMSAGGESDSASIVFASSGLALKFQ